MNKCCPLKFGFSEDSCIKNKCALWHDSQQCAFLATAVNTDDTAAILEEVKDVLDEVLPAVEELPPRIPNPSKVEDDN